MLCIPFFSFLWEIFTNGIPVIVEHSSRSFLVIIQSDNQTKWIVSRQFSVDCWILCWDDFPSSNIYMDEVLE